MDWRREGVSDVYARLLREQNVRRLHGSAGVRRPILPVRPFRVL